MHWHWQGHPSHKTQGNMAQVSHLTATVILFITMVKSHVWKSWLALDFHLLQKCNTVLWDLVSISGNIVLLFFVYLAARHYTQPCLYPRYCVHLSRESTMWFDFQICWSRSGHRGGVTTQLSFKVNSRGQHPGSGARSHKGPVSVRVPAENLSVGGIVLTSKSRERNYWLTAMWQ